MQNEKITEIIKDAFELERNEQYKNAIEMLYQGLNIEPDNSTILAQISFLYFKLKNFDIAKEYAQKSLNIDSETNFAKEVLIKIYIESNQIDEFQSFVSQIDTNNISQELLNTIFQGLIKFNLYNDAINLCNITTNEENFNDLTYYYYALSNYFIKDYEKSKKYAELSKEKNPNNTDNLLLLANLAYKDKDYDKVKTILSSIEESKLPAHGYFLLGKIELSNLQYQKAADYFTKSLSLDDKNGDCLYSLANAYYFMGWLNEAQKTISKAKSIIPDDTDILYLSAEIYFIQNKYDLALDIITSILNLSPDYTNAKLLKINIYIKKELYEIARCELIDILNTDAMNTNALKLYCQACQNLGFKEEVLKTLEKILIIEPDNTDYMCKLAECFCDMGKWEDAKIVLKNIFEITNVYEAAYELLIKVYFNLKDYNKAEDIAKKWITINPNSHFAYYILAKINLTIDIQTALNNIQTALTLNPEEKKYYILAGQIYEALNNYKTAFQYFDEAFNISADKDTAVKLLNLAVNINDIDFVEKTFNKIRKIAPFDLDITFNYAKYLISNENTKKALKVLNALQKGLSDKDLKAIVKNKMKEIKQ